MKKDTTIEVSDRNLVLRLVGFVLALIVAGVAIATGVTQLTKKEPGWAVVAQQDDDTAMLYRAGVEFQYHYTGDSAAIRAATRELEPLFSDSLRRAYRLLDAEEAWTGYTNLATLNAHPGEDIAVPAALFQVLTDAAARTARGEGYSLYAGPLNQAWADILYASNPQDYDPSVNPEEAERLATLTQLANDPTACRLTVVDAEQYVLRLEVSQAARDTLDALEVETGVLDLGLLHDAYLLQLVTDDLENSGWRCGVLTTRSGLTVNLSESDAGDFYLHDLVEGELKEVGTLPGGANTALSRFKAFPVEEAGYYTVNGLWRSPYVTAAGEPSRLIRASYVPGTRDALVEAVYENLRLAAAQTAEAVESAKGEKTMVFFLNDGLKP